MRNELEAPEFLRRFGRGWISGVLGLSLGLGGFLLVVSLCAPGAFALTELARFRETVGFRVALHTLLILGFGFSALSLGRRRQRIFGTTGIIAVLAAPLPGGLRHATAEESSYRRGPAYGYLPYTSRFEQGEEHF